MSLKLRAKKCMLGLRYENIRSNIEGRGSGSYERYINT